MLSTNWKSASVKWRPNSAPNSCSAATLPATTKSTKFSLTLGKHWDGLDGLVHAIAFAPKEALSGDFLDSISREAFNTAHEISAYSLPALAKAARPMMQGRNAAIVALSYLGAVRAIPNYNIMGMAKASLEAGIRFTAACLGKEGIRCNGISAGPIKTLAASGIADFSKLLGHVASHNPLGRNVTTEEVGNTAAFLLLRPPLPASPARLPTLTAVTASTR